MKEEKPIVVYGAMAANIVIAVLKYIVAFITHSSAMLSEAIHSTADTGNEILLLLGLRQSRKPPDNTHPAGHGRELYFWALIVAIMIFSVGSGMSIYEGITSLNQKNEIQNVGWTYFVLSFSFVAEGISWSISFRKLAKQRKPQESFWRTLRASKDPSTFVVFGEDSAALAGLLVAFLGIFLGQLLHSHYPDVIASMLIGLILAIVAIYLVGESKSLLIGETADADVVTNIQKIVASDPSVEKVQQPLTVQLSPQEFFLALDVQFKPDLEAAELVRVIDELEKKIHQEHQDVGRIFIEIERLKGHNGKQGHK